MILGKLMLKRTYSAREYASVLLITAGIVVCTLATVNSLKSGVGQKNSNKTALGQVDSRKSEEEEIAELFWWLVGKV